MDTHTYTYRNAHIYMNTFTYTHTCTRTHTRTCTHIRTCTQTHIYTHAYEFLIMFLRHTKIILTYEREDQRIWRGYLRIFLLVVLCYKNSGTRKDSKLIYIFINIFLLFVFFFQSLDSLFGPFRWLKSAYRATTNEIKYLVIKTTASETWHWSP